ncbi:putative white-brown complex homolog protein 30 [Vicia villosa]|uniref:putative white-brown complex homolog protein 30 n=1 Tax=Vicia villosa TaxID=3911 RepID=UPI00273B0DD9|nr:putative white-brown complex homolog protein 30 [Vicia villosa]XP_058771145.1 putative white-brown complex homolog protein 30 [Vicia villosa]
MRNHVFYIALFFLFSFTLLPRIHCAEGTFAPSFYTDEIYKELQNIALLLNKDIKSSLDFCIKDPKKDWEEAFDFTGRLDFVDSCVKKKGDFRDRICTAAEIRYYFHGFLAQGAATDNYVKPNKNCNLTSWVSGCEPGWGCSTGVNIDLKKDTKEIPKRTKNCKPCCEGFFCPQGLTCMIPCPLGSYCPLAKLNNQTGLCDPYSYQIPQGEPGHTCGSADIWTGVVNNSDIFCSPGSYCPTTTRKVSCDRGYYCRMGSTHQNPCSKFSQCNPNTTNQNMHAYGALLIVALSTVLIFIYNCSDQVLATRERRKAKSREAAARQVRETVQARERWKIAKDAAKRNKTGLQDQLVRTFSRRKSSKQAEQVNPATGNSVLPPMPPEQPSAATKDPTKEPSDLTKMLNSLENDPNSNEGFNLKIGDKNIKKQLPKGKNLHTQSQILRYAYGQIEKEKAQQDKNNLTFSGVISMAADGEEVRSRPEIEVAFKDLTLTLKGKKKHVMRCVTGKIMPGRVSAVMGPSGAGKTTFLSALAGKIRGCTMTGSILINGKPESIHCYQKIIGYVPQDDIVHGNLTVEENLRFSARCRLSDDLPKPDKVLIVERVIETLGLQAIRDSLVGTVEKRGISGGQRKRVNVGLEMVMEPSLLILDEPTTGLDSASSSLLLKALRREAAEGVNVCMVLHQPSYTLFRTFDDIIFLAKGGLTAYHGPVKKVEEYFAGIGIVVPDRVNPPDHYIDILEGLVKPNEGVTHQQLPVRWMLHNGYPVPPDMLHFADEISASSSSTNINHAAKSTDEATDQSFAGEFWEDMKSNVQLQKDHIEATFLRTKDLSNRRTPGISRQYRYYLGRIGKQQLREAKSQAVDYLLLLVAGAILGTLTKVNDETFGSLGYTYTVIAVSLLCKIAALRSFSLDKLQYWRESASGISSLAHFLSKDTIDLFSTLVKPLVYLSMFYFFSNPRSSFGSNYAVLVCLVYCVTGMAYAIAIYFEPAPAQLGSVLLPVVMTLISNQTREGLFMKILIKMCYPNWALEAFIIANAERYTGVWLITRCSSLMTSSYNVNDWATCLVVLIFYGIVARVVAFICLMITQKK